MERKNWKKPTLFNLSHSEIKTAQGGGAVAIEVIFYCKSNVVALNPNTKGTYTMSYSTYADAGTNIIGTACS